MCSRPLVACLSALLLAVPHTVSTQSATSAPHYTFTVIADVTNCYNFGSPVLGGNGDVAFIGNCPSPVIDWRVVRKGDGVTLTDVYVADGTGGYGIGEAVASINDLGVVAFAGSRSSTGHSVILAGDGGPLTVVADTSIQTQWSVLGRPSINNANAVAFMAVPAGGGSYNTVVRADTGGAFTTIAKPGDSAPGVGTIFQAFEPALNNVGQVEFFVNTVEGVPAIYRGTGAALTRITSGGAINSFNGINDSGRVAFAITSVGIKSGTGGALTTIAAASASFFPSSSVVAINNANVAAFEATDLTTNKKGIYVGDGVATELVIQSGDVIAGLGTVTSVFISEEAINDSGQVAFVLLYNDGTPKRAIVRADPILPNIATIKAAASATGCKNVNASVTLDRPAPPGGVVVELEVSNPAASVPASVRIASAKTSGKFTVHVTPVTAKQTGAITATLESSVETKPFNVVPISVQSVALTPNPVAGGSAVTGTATLECAAPYDVSIALSSTKPSVAQPAVPSFVVPAGTRTKTFGVNTATVVAADSATIKAAANGRTKSKKLVVNP
jgi:hypothetical protein